MSLDRPTRSSAHSAVQQPVYTPATVSVYWRDFWATFVRWPPLPLPGPDEVAGWDSVRAQVDSLIAGETRPATAEALNLVTRSAKRNGVPVIELGMAGRARGDRILMFLHGGAYTFQSAGSTLFASGMLANATGLPVVSVDYTVAPRGKWNTVTDQVIAVYQSLLNEGYAPGCIGLLGESAGGGLALGATLKMRDQGLPLPGALVLWSPWADITATGDTTVTLAPADPILDAVSLQASADAYAPREEQRNPYVSPVYGDYAKDFPPTLIQGGTKELFLSHFVRLYQAMDAGGRNTTLDLYEGMPHIFQVIGAESPEAQRAVRKSAKYLTDHLRRK